MAASPVDTRTMAAKRVTRPAVTPRERSFREDPAILAGHLGIVVCKSLRLHWHLARLDTSSGKMTFPQTGSIDAPAKGLDWLTECMMSAAEEAFDQDHIGELY